MSKKYIIFNLFVMSLLLSCQAEDEVQEVSLSGKIQEIYYQDGIQQVQNAEEVIVQLYQNGELINETVGAEFAFADLQATHRYTIIPIHTCEVLENVNQDDVDMLKQYINQQQSLSIDRQVAADIDRNLMINQDDYEALSECMNSPMMMFCLDYRFYLDGCESLSDIDMINEIEYRNLKQSHTDILIYAVKSGDLTQ